MRRLLKISSLRHLMQQIPRQNYCFYRHIFNVNDTFISKPLGAVRSQCYFSTVSSPQESAKNSITQLQEEFPEPKKTLYQVLNEAFLRDQTLDLKPSVFIEPILDDSGHEHIWKARLQMKWPESFEVEGLAKRKTDAINISFLHACQKLKHLGLLDNSNKPALQKRKITDRDINVAKGHLLNIYQKIWHRSGNKDFIPRFNTVLSQGLSGHYWQTELTITYPENKVFTAVAFRSSSAEGIAAFEALSWLNTEGIINKKFRFLDYSKQDEERLQEFHHAPYSICLPPTLQDKMQAVLCEIEKQKLLLSGKKTSDFIDPIKEESDEKDDVVLDVITDNPYCQLNDQELQDRSNFLYERNKSIERKLLSTLSDIKKAKSLLPISQKRDDILKLIDENQVVVLSGDTGCGKSTQVPQFILDHYINNMKGAECNIVVTQPRRISAIALSERVAKERGEKIGDIIGHHIRFNKVLPHGNGAILYCTTGILLRKLLSNPNLEGVSHVIIDEVHERNVQIDFIFILLKNILETNKNIKVLLMSASFNTNLFAQYFNSSRVIHIPGKMFPVEEYFLEDLEKDIPGIKNIEQREPILDVDLIANVVNHIDKNQPPGAILCFLPGWQDIRTVHNKLLENEDSSRKLLIFPIHSRLPHEEQRNIFLIPSEGQRKIILATNIAETSITINDVVYVVNSGLHKGTQLDVEGIASLSTQWITKANVRQRKGRAGRVKPGKCYHLFSWKTFLRMDEYPVAEILRAPLESVILDCKLYCQAIKAEEFLSKALQPPATTSIQCGLKDLQILGVLDENENLTDLGKVAAHITIHPRLSVALVYAAFLGCLNPVLTICAILTLEKEPFVNTLDDKLKIREVKIMHDNSLCSDHLALTKIYDTWNSFNEEADTTQYIENNLLDPQTLLRIKQLKEHFLEDLGSEDLIMHNKNSYDNEFIQPYNSHAPSIFAALTAAFFPNVIKILQGEISQGRLNKNTLVYSIIKGQKAYIQKESVVSEEENFPTPWLVYFSALKSEARRKAMVSAVSSIPGICLLLMTGRDISMTNVKKGNTDEENLAVLSIDDYKKLNFSCTTKEAHLLLDWRECFREIFQLYLNNLKQNCEEREYMLSCHNKFIPVLKEVLETPQVPFTKGQIHKFVKNELISQPLEI